MSVKDAYNFKAINERLTTSGLLSEEQLVALPDEGYQSCINLLPHGDEFALPGEAEMVRELDIAYEYIPVDFAAPTSEDYEQFARAVAANGSRKLHIHCAANYRVSAFYAIYGVRELGWSRAAALEFIRSLWEIDEFPQWRTLFDTLTAD